MADQDKYPGRLIAVDGSRGKDTAAAADAIVERMHGSGVECAISRWDASGLFGELAATARGDRNISMRTLALIYASDLAFRLRWEIRPVLEAGGVVVAAPYIETAIAFGAACGLSEEWTRHLLRLAPSADVRVRSDECKVDQPWKRRADRGFPEYCAMMLDASAPRKVSKGARHEMMRLLGQAHGRKIYRASPEGVDVIAAAITGSRRAAPRRSASRPRSGRK
jgi:hypothetical protein